MNTQPTEPALAALSSYWDAALGWLKGLRLPEEPMLPLVLGAALLLLLASLILLRQRNRLLQAQKARNNAESLASSLFDALPDAAFIADPSGRFLSVNPAFAHLMGRTERELSALRLDDIFTPSVAERLEYRPVDSDEEEPEEPLALRPGERERFLPIKTPLFDTHGMLIGVLVQLRPAPRRAAARRSEPPLFADPVPTPPELAAPAIDEPAPPEAPSVDDAGLMEALKIAVKVSRTTGKTGTPAADPAPEAPQPPRRPEPKSHGYQLFEVIPGTEDPSTLDYPESARRGRGKH